MSWLVLVALLAAMCIGSGLDDWRQRRADTRADERRACEGRHPAGRSLSTPTIPGPRDGRDK